MGAGGREMVTGLGELEPGHQGGATLRPNLQAVGGWPAQPPEICSLSQLGEDEGLGRLAPRVTHLGLGWGHVGGTPSPPVLWALLCNLSLRR